MIGNHNKQIEAKFITRIIDNFGCFNITLNQLFQFRPEKLEIILASDLDYFLDECQKLDLLIRTLEKSYIDYHSLIAHTPPLQRQQIFINIKRSFSYLNKENNKQEQKKIIQDRVQHDLKDFTENYEANIHKELLQRLLALK